MNASNVIDISTSRLWVTDEQADENAGYKARIENEPFNAEATDAWKHGWKEADKEWSGREVDF
jgi:hypothetical protein